MMLNIFKKSTWIALLLIISTGILISISSPQNDFERNIFLVNNSEFWKAFNGAFDNDLLDNPYKFLDELKLKMIQDEKGKIHFFDSKNMEPVLDATIGKRFVNYLQKLIVSIYKENEQKYVKDYMFLKKFMELNPSYPMLLPDLTKKGSINFKDLENDIEAFMIPVFKQLMAEIRKEHQEESQFDKDRDFMIEEKGAMAESADPRLKFWMRRVQKIIQQQWNPPDLEILGSAQVTVNFAVKRNGDVEAIGISTSSGNSDLDQVAINTIEDVGKMPPIPPNFREKDEISINIMFTYRGE